MKTGMSRGKDYDFDLDGMDEGLEKLLEDLANREAGSDGEEYEDEEEEYEERKSPAGIIIAILLVAAVTVAVLYFLFLRPGGFQGFQSVQDLFDRTPAATQAPTEDTEAGDAEPAEGTDLSEETEQAESDFSDGTGAADTQAAPTPVPTPTPEPTPDTSPIQFRSVYSDIVPGEQEKLADSLNCDRITVRGDGTVEIEGYESREALKATLQEQLDAMVESFSGPPAYPHFAGAEADEDYSRFRIKVTAVELSPKEWDIQNEVFTLAALYNGLNGNAADLIQIDLVNLNGNVVGRISSTE